MNDFSKTEHYGFFKPTAGVTDWVHLLNANWEVINFVLQRQDAIIKRLETAVEAQRGEIRLLQGLAEDAVDND